MHGNWRKALATSIFTSWSHKRLVSQAVPILLSPSQQSYHYSPLFNKEPLHALMNPATMLQTHSAKRAVQCLPKARRFSSTPSPAAVSPYRRTAQAQTSSASKRNVSDTAKRSAQAAAVAPQRPVPSPAFNRNDERLRDVQPLQPFRQPEMDHSFVGMTGGQIFHEMMRRQGVKHICEYSNRRKV